MDTSQLPTRSRRILAALVREFIETGQPVGSMTLAGSGGFDLSSATLRSVLANLEELGYLRQPHTSAGRVPTDLGYRCYVDTLLENRRPGRPTRAVAAELQHRAGNAALADDVLSQVPHVLSRASHHVGFAIGPHHEAEVLHRVEFVPLAGTAVLVIMVARGGQVSHKVVDIGERLRAEELERAAGYLNSEFAGLRLSEVRSAVAERLREGRTLCDALLARSLRLAQPAFEDVCREHLLFIQGAASLVDEMMEPASSVSRNTLRALLKLVEERHYLVRLLTEYIEGPGLTVVIGTEHASPELQGFSLVASTYFDGRRTGGVGVIGPKRMHYSRAIAVVDTVAQTVSRLLQGRRWDADTAQEC